jgi:maltooligosyltrehalose trehalohydrolase
VASALLALQPSLPLYFMGEEWGAPEPFQYFVSHGDPALVEAVRKGRRDEFKSFAWAGKVPDPQAEATFERSRIDRAHRESAEGQAALRWHRALLELRRQHPACSNDSHDAVEARIAGRTLLLRRFASGHEMLVVAAFDEGPCTAALPPGRWRVLLDSSAPQFGPAADAAPARLDGSTLQLCGRQAVVLEKV